MKNILSTLILFLSLNASFGQKEYDDLRILYADGNYEKLAKVADKYANSDATKKDPWPYMWLAKGLYKIHQSGSSDPVFKNAYKESINAMNKFMKFDKTGSLVAEQDNKEFLDMLQGSLVEQIENELAGGNYRKAFGWVNTYKKISSNLTGQILLEGTCKFRTDDKSTGFTLWKTADDQLKTISSLDSWSEADKQMLKLGAMETAECYVAVKKVENAKALLNKVAQWFEKDEAFKEVYDKIVN
jgi:hypothetical protein